MILRSCGDGDLPPKMVVIRRFGPKIGGDLVMQFASGDGDLKAILTLYCGFYGLFPKIFSLREHKLMDMMTNSLFVCKSLFGIFQPVNSRIIAQITVGTYVNKKINNLKEFQPLQL